MSHAALTIEFPLPVGTRIRGVGRVAQYDDIFWFSPVVEHDDGSLEVLQNRELQMPSGYCKSVDGSCSTKLENRRDPRFITPKGSENQRKLREAQNSHLFQTHRSAGKGYRLEHASGDHTASTFTIYTEKQLHDRLILYCAEIVRPDPAHCRPDRYTASFIFMEKQVLQNTERDIGIGRVVNGIWLYWKPSNPEEMYEFFDKRCNPISGEYDVECRGYKLRKAKMHNGKWHWDGDDYFYMTEKDLLKKCVELEIPRPLELKTRIYDKSHVIEVDGRREYIEACYVGNRCAHKDLSWPLYKVWFNAEYAELYPDCKDRVVPVKTEKQSPTNPASLECALLVEVDPPHFDLVSGYAQGRLELAEGQGLYDWSSYVVEEPWAAIAPPPRFWAGLVSHTESRFQLDAIVLSEELKRCGYEVKLVLGASPQTVLDCVNWLAKTAGRDDVVLFYTTGHSSRNASGELELNYDDTAVSLKASDVAASLNKIESQKVLTVVHCCYAGAFPSSSHMASNSAAAKNAAYALARTSGKVSLCAGPRDNVTIDNYFPEGLAAAFRSAADKNERLQVFRLISTVSQYVNDKVQWQFLEVETNGSNDFDLWLPRE